MIKHLGKANKNILCIYHGYCADGFSAAWVVNKWAKKMGHTVEFFAGHFGKDAPDVKDKHVIIVDFSYDKDTMIQMSREASSITVLDHHKTAKEALENLESKLYCAAEIQFDMNKSGCGLTWDYFYPGIQKPKVLIAVEDRDLWLFNHESTREVSANVFSMKYTFENWDYLMDNSNFDEIVDGGKSIERKHMRDVDELDDGLTHMVTMVVFGDVFVFPMANVPYMFASEMGNKMCIDYPSVPFAGTYYLNKDGQYKVSLRSTDRQSDASEIAREFGGGGHRNSCGFTIDKLPWTRVKS